MRTRSLFILLIAVSILPIAALAQDRGAVRVNVPLSCGTSACRTDEAYRDGACYPRCSPPAPCSHTLASCEGGTTLDVATGRCIPPGGCGGGGCEERPACRANETYRDGGCYPSCSPPAPCSHTIATCDSGWTLDVSRGVCRGNCRSPMMMAPGGIRMTLRPDLTFRSAQLGSLEKPASTVKYGQHYYVCFTVANIGSAASGPFRVGAGGLGVPVAPFQDHASLASGASRDGCIEYPTTPPSGDYKLELKVDSLDAVSESREDNNTSVIAVKVVP